MFEQKRAGGFISAGLIAVALTGFIIASSRRDHSAAETRVRSEYGRLPMSFEVNRGQADAAVKFLARGRGYQVFFTDTEAVLSLSRPQRVKRGNRGTALSNPRSAIRNPQSNVLRLKFDGAAPARQVIGVDPLPGKSNYFIGNDPKAWRTDIPNYARVECREIYPGVSVAYYGAQRSLEYDLIVAPGADPQAITVSFEGADRMELNAEGDLELHLNGEVIYQRSPAVYQQVNGGRRAVTSRYVIKGENRVAFEVGSYDAGKSLVIDPVLDYSTYLGGGGDDTAQSIEVDASGNAYVTGVTAAADFVTKDGLQSANRGGPDVFIAKINSDGSALSYSTYLGGGSDDAGNGIAVDAAGNVYVTGYTTSTDFHTRNPLQPTNRGKSDAFVAKINPAGSQLLYATYLGSSQEDVGYAIATDAAGAAYVTGYTAANDFNTQAPFQPHRGGFDAFVAKINPSGSALSYSTYLGGADGDLGAAIAVDGAGNAYVAGYTASPDFNTLNPLQAAYRGAFDGFVAKINAAGSSLTYSTYLGGGDDDQCYGIAVDGAGNAYVTGVTASTDFPTRNPLQSARRGNSDVFVAKINAAGGELLYSTYLGGDGSDAGRGIAADATGNVYLTGDTASTNFPTKNPLQAANRGLSDAFIAKLNAAGSELAFTTYLGGSRQDIGYSIAIDGVGSIYVTGATASQDFNTSNPLQSDNLGGIDAFVAKVTADGAQLGYSTYLGGSDSDLGLSVAVDSAGAAYVTGLTAAADFPAQNPLQRTNRGGADAFVAKINASGSAFLYASYFGGSGLDQGLDVAVDQAGAAYVAGVTTSTDFSLRNPLQAANRGGGDAFVAKLSADGAELVYSTYFGGGGDDAGYSLAVDGAGNVYLAGSTGSTNLTTRNPLQPGNRGEDDAFVAKLNAAGTALIYSTYLGGSGSEAGYSIAVDGTGAACVTGVTASTDFNTKSALQSANRGELDAFVAKINPDGSTLSYSTYLGGSGLDFGYGIAVDASGNVYVTGATSSTDFAIRSQFQSANKGSFDAFITKINPAGSMLIYSTYLGGDDSDSAYGIAVDATGNVYLTGNTASANFPVKDAIQATNHGGGDAFVTKLNAAGSDLVFSTYLGGSGADEGDAIALDGVSNIYVTGQTGSLNFPVANPVQPAASGGIDAFILKLGAGAGAGTAASVSAASFLGVELAAESIVAAFGDGLATGVQVADSVPLPTTLAGTSVRVKDSAGVERPAPLFFVAPAQVNYQVPPGTAAGPALVTITSSDGKVSSGTTLISALAPGLFSANADGQGVAAAVALRVKADGAQSFEPVSRFDAAQNKFVAAPIDLGPEGEQVFLLLFGTGLRGHAGLPTVKVKIGGVDAETLFLGPQGGFVGLDQGNIRIPRSLAGRGEVDVVATAGAKTANIVSVNVK
jgi:uncharacterized protein (TIGR03437 family)